MSLKIEQIDKYRWRIPKQGNMRTDGIIYTTAEMLELIKHDESLRQVANVACLPGIIGPSLAMPDIHAGYGFPIGGVAAFDLERGVISPGGVGYDINCGVRLLRSNLKKDEVLPVIEDLVDTLFVNIPTGVGSARKDFKLKQAELKKVLKNGAKWAVSKGFGTQTDLEHIEAGGCLPQANPELVSKKAYERGKDQLGTLGSGNHFVEVGYVDKIYHEKLAEKIGLFKGQITVIIHTGSRGLGHQICDDYIKVMLRAASKYGISLPDRQLCCAPIQSKEGQDYLSAMACAANFAFANRQMITHWVRETFEHFFKRPYEELGLELVYDVCHNIAKIEEHTYNGKKVRVCVHRKGATRAFPAGHSEVPSAYREIGQPVLIPGDMGRYSYVLVGTPKAIKETFGSTCHGAGRVMSRHQAIKMAKGRNIAAEMKHKGIYVRGAGKKTLIEEVSEAYKDVADVVEVVHGAGISLKVARLRPLGVIKG
jgi:tRNA-splicing ligase RtcB